MSETIPDWADNVSALAPAIITAGDAPGDGGGFRNFVDLKAKFGAWLFIGGGRAAAGTQDAPLRYNVRRISNTVVFPNSPFSRVGNEVTSDSTTVDATSTAGGFTLNVTNTSGFVAGDLIVIMDTGPSVNNLEFCRVARVDNPGAGGELIVDQQLQFTHDSPDIVSNASDIFQMWLPGGSIYDFGFDYSSSSSGPDIGAMMKLQTFDSFITT